MWDLRLAGLLHDVGKIGVPDSVLLKKDTLLPEEIALIRKHPDKGVRILAKLASTDLYPIVDAVRYHHERYDGTGYPEGLSGKSIPLFARIIAIADSFDAMITDRPYRLGLGNAAALAEVRKFAGTQFDPALSELFLAMMQETECRHHCDRLSTCVIMKRIREKEIAQAYEIQYCRSNFLRCARYNWFSPTHIPDNLLSDGNFFEMKKR